MPATYYEQESFLKFCLKCHERMLLVPAMMAEMKIVQTREPLFCSILGFVMDEFIITDK